MGKVVELTVSKGKTVKAGDREEWLKVEYSVKALVDDQVDLEAAKAHLEGLLDGWLTGISPKLVEAKALDIFPKELAEMLVFEDKGEYIVATPKAYLGSENFAKIAEIVRKHGGDYISKGKESHFKIPKKQAK